MAEKKSKLSRTVERNCIEVEKAADWNKRHFSKPIIHVQPFIPEHDFAEDDLYLKLSANLNAREIEWCKARVMGFSGYHALEQIQPTLSAAGRHSTLNRFQAQDNLLALIKHLTMLWNKYHNPLSFDPAEAVAELIREVRNATGRQKFEMMVKLIETLGIGESVKKAAQKTLNLDMQPEQEEESIEEFIAKLRINGNISRTGTREAQEPPDAAV